MLTVEQLMEEIARMPAQAKRMEVRIGTRRWAVGVDDVRFEGNHVVCCWAN